MDLRQYQIVLVNLDPTVGSEIKKTRPCVIISPDEMNRHLRTIVLAPMTSNLKPYPTRVAVFQNNRPGMMVIDQIRTVDKSRIMRILGKLSSDEIVLCKRVIQETFVD
ncbi:type II toxin-antitoxin system PemK/MazF family toxin [Algoriphagus formosus]|uniref:mRNA interferase n=1 Tax=Algoriphagus formosus TaxID=2007308 RepID=A0A4R5V5D1_9BACT|nr:type II toxin-antitoxin system PemK/MazF family toxin [Algoriphagus aquimaris]TDK46686.1 type II toxin-antitoxin system PemK/MazF family toxin [Algoriphagus aquimaris]